MPVVEKITVYHDECVDGSMWHYEEEGTRDCFPSGEVNGKENFTLDSEKGECVVALVAYQREDEEGVCVLDALKIITNTGRVGEFGQKKDDDEVQYLTADPGQAIIGWELFEDRGHDNSPGIAGILCDEMTWFNGKRLKSITGWEDTHVRALGFTYDDDSYFEAGTQKGVDRTEELEDDEYITSATVYQGRSGGMVNMTYMTSNEREIGFGATDILLPENYAFKVIAKRSWAGLSSELRKAAETLGLDEDMWASDEPWPCEETEWKDLSDEEKEAVTCLGYNEGTWDAVEGEGTWICVKNADFKGKYDVAKADGSLEELKAHCAEEAYSCFAILSDQDEGRGYFKQFDGDFDRSECDDSEGVDLYVYTPLNKRMWTRARGINVIEIFAEEDMCIVKPTLELTEKTMDRENLQLQPAYGGAIFGPAVVEEEVEADPMLMAEAIADMREQMMETFKEEEKIMEILCAVACFDDLVGAIEAALMEFAEGFVEENENLPQVPDLSKQVDKISDIYNPAYEARMEEQTAALVESVFADFAEGHMDSAIEEAGDSEDNIADILTARIAEIAEKCVADDAFLATKGVPEGALDETSASTIEAFVAEFVLRATNVQEQSVIAAAGSLYSSCITARETQYMFEMSKEWKQEDFDKTPVLDALQTLTDQVDQVADLPVNRLEDNGREGALDFWNNAQKYAYEEASYLRTRADRVEAKGPRDPVEGYAQIQKIEASLDKYMEYVNFIYDDGTNRKVGTDEDVSYNVKTIGWASDQRIQKIEYWKSSKAKYISEGMAVTLAPSGDRHSLMGSKTKGIFGTDGSDKVWEVDAGEEYIIQLDLEGTEGARVKGVTGRRVDYEPQGPWKDSVDDWRFEGHRLIYTIGENTSFFIPLPYEHLMIENGMMLVEKRLMEA